MPRYGLRCVLLFGVALACFAAPPPAQTDVAAGRQVFRICQACHSLDPGHNLIGPSLAGLIGRRAGTASGFDYSQAMTQANITWDARSLDACLADPQKVVPGNKMPFGGLKSDLDRQELIAYLEVAARPGAAAGGALAVAGAGAAVRNQPAEASGARATSGMPPDMPDVKYTLRSGISEGRMIGDTVRFFFGVGGPNFTSSFHLIGGIFDKVYFLGGLSSPPLIGIQTVSVPPGGAVVTDFKTHVPGAYSIVDHALSRAERGLAGILYVEGAPNPDIFNSTSPQPAPAK